MFWKCFQEKSSAQKLFKINFLYFGGSSAPKTVIYEKEVMLLWFTNHCPKVQWYAVIVLKLFFANKTIMSGYCVTNAEKIIFSYISVNIFPLLECLVNIDCNLFIQFHFYLYYKIRTWI